VSTAAVETHLANAGSRCGIHSEQSIRYCKCVIISLKGLTRRSGTDTTATSDTDKVEGEGGPSAAGEVGSAADAGAEVIAEFLRDKYKSKSGDFPDLQQGK
jgi:hypothetical protein